MKRYTLEEYKKVAMKIQNSEYAEKCISEEMEFCDSVRKVIPDAAIVVELEYTENDESCFYEYCYTVFTRSNIVFTIRKEKNNFSIYPDSSFMRGSYYDIEKAQRHLARPNKIGVLTQKKVQEWVDYYTATIANLNEIHTESQRKEEEFLQQIAGEPVKWAILNKKGEIRRNGFVFYFSLEGGQIYTKIDFDYRVGQDFAAFQLLADNRFPAQVE